MHVYSPTHCFHAQLIYIQFLSTRSKINDRLIPWYCYSVTFLLFLLLSSWFFLCSLHANCYVTTPEDKRAMIHPRTVFTPSRHCFILIVSVHQSRSSSITRELRRKIRQLCCMGINLTYSALLSITHYDSILHKKRSTFLSIPHHFSSVIQIVLIRHTATSKRTSERRLYICTCKRCYGWEWK